MRKHKRKIDKNLFRKYFLNPIYLILILVFNVHKLYADENKKKFSPELQEFINNTKIEKSWKGEDAIIFLKEGNMSVNEEGFYEISVHIIGKILNRDGKLWYNIINVYFDSYYEDISFDFARTVKNSETIIDVAKDAVQIKTDPINSAEGIYSDKKILSFTLPALNVGSFFEYKYTVKEKTKIIKGEWFSAFDFNYLHYRLAPPFLPKIDPVYKSRFILKVPKDINFVYALQNIEITPIIKEKDKFKTYVWEIKKLPAIQILGGMPNQHGVVPSLVLSSIEKWEVIDEWAYEKIFSKIEASQEILKLLERITKDCQSDEEKIGAIYDFIQKEIIYMRADLGRGGYTPHSVDQILLNKYGDCKDQVTLFISLLKSAGIDAYPALINPYPYSSMVNKKVPAPNFVHLIVYIPSEERCYWLDPTNKESMFPNLHYTNQDCIAFIVNGEGGQFLQTPDSKPEDNQGICNLSYEIDDTTFGFNLLFEATGAIGENMKSTLSLLNKEQQSDIYKELAKKEIYPLIIEDSIEFQNIDNNKSPVKIIVRYKCEKPSFLSLSGFTYRSGAGVPLRYYLFAIYTGPFSDNRKFDYIFPYKFKLISSERYVPPSKEMEIAEIPLNTFEDNEYFSFYRKFVEIEDTVIAKWEYISKKKTIKKSDYKEYCKAMEKVLDHLLWRVTYKLKGNPAINN